MATEKIKRERMWRNFPILRDAIDETKRTVQLSFSSEEPAERSFGWEILDHSPQSVDLRRLQRQGALLIDHDVTKQIGVIEEVTVGADRKGRASVRFGRSARAQEIFQDVVDGIRANVSVGYEYGADPILKKEKMDGKPVYLFKSWTPYEISLVAVPMDISVGVGRGKEDIELEIPTKEIVKMEEKKETAPEITATSSISVESTPKIDAKEMERQKIAAIDNMCQMNKMDSNQRDYWVKSGLTMEEISKDMIKIMEQRSATSAKPASELGLTPKETQKFSLIKAIQASVENNWTNAPFELEASRAIADKLRVVPVPHRFYVPYEIQERQVPTTGRRDATVSGSGAYLVETSNVGFIELLRNRSVARRMGARVLSGLVGNVMIPKQTVSATSYWLATEATAITEGNQTFVQVPLAPNNVGAYTEISRQLLLQSSPGIEGLVTSDLAASVAIAADLAVLAGTGTEQPTGITQTASIGTVTGTSLAFAGIMEFQSDVAANNVQPVSGGYVTTPTVAADMMQTMKVTNDYSPLWEGNLWDGTMCGFRAMSSMQCPSATMIYGDWSEVIIGEWGTLSIETNPFANFAAGIIGVRCFYTMDVAVRYAGAFSVATSIT